MTRNTNRGRRIREHHRHGDRRSARCV